MRFHLVTGLFGLAFLLACAPPVVPTDTSASVELYSGGPFNGYLSRTLYPDDVLTVTVGGGGQKERSENFQLLPGAFTAARDHILTNTIPQRLLIEDLSCDDCGINVVAYADPARKIEMKDMGWGPQLAALTAEVEAIIARHDPKAAATP